MFVFLRVLLFVHCFLFLFMLFMFLIFCLFREPFRARAARRLWRDRDVQGGSDTSRYAVASWEAGARPWFKSCVGQRALLGMGLSRLDPVPSFLFGSTLLYDVVARVCSTRFRDSSF